MHELRFAGHKRDTAVAHDAPIGPQGEDLEIRTRGGRHAVVVADVRLGIDLVVCREACKTKPFLVSKAILVGFFVLAFC